MRPDRTHRVAVLDLPGALRSAFAISLDVLEAANRAARGGVTTRPFEILTLRPGQRLPRATSAVVVPGIGCVTPAEVAAALHSAHGRWAVRLVRSAHAKGSHVVTSCASVFLAADAGVLDGGAATTSWFLAGALADRYPAVQVRGECVLVESQRCLTGGAALAHADVMLAFVERVAGGAIADLCARYLLLDRRASQRPYVVLTALLQGDPQLARAEAWVRAHLSEPLTVERVASAAALSPRTFARRLHRACGLSPSRLVQRIRIDAAQAHLAAGLSFDATAPLVGYGDASALRRVFRAHGHRALRRATAPDPASSPRGAAPRR